jgi:O-antigen ligase
MEKALEIVLVLVTLGVALDFGGVQPAAYSIAEMVLFVSVVLLVWKRSREPGMKLGMPLWPVLFVLLAAVEAVPLPAGIVAKLSPARLLDPALAGLAGIDRAWITLSIYPHETILTLMKMLAYLSAFLLAAHLFDSRKRRSWLVVGLIGLGSFEAAYGITQYLTGWQKIFTYTKTSYTESATGTYINHDHFAGVLELTIPFAFASAFYFFQIWSEKIPGARRAVAASRSSAGIQAMFYLFLVAMMVVGVGFSISRGGILGTVVSIIVVAFLALARLKRGRKAGLLGVLLLLTSIAAYGLWVGLGSVTARFEQVHQTGYLRMEGRIATWADSLRLIRDYPLTGTGLGTFGLAFRHYQTFMVNFFFDHAHNDYLEFASDTGLLGAVLLFMPILYLLIRMVVSFLPDPRRYRRSVILGCIGSTLAILIHSIMDFNLQIPANALIFSMVLGIGYKAACLEPREESAGAGTVAMKQAARTR